MTVSEAILRALFKMFYFVGYFTKMMKLEYGWNETLKTDCNFGSYFFNHK
jgi:hypothetical protein